MEHRLNLSQFAHIVLRWSWLILLAGALAGGTAYSVSQSLPKEYQSQAKILIGSLAEVNYDQQLGNQQLAATYAGLATITPVLEGVIAELGLPDDPVSLVSRIDVTAPVNQAIVTVVARASSATGSAQLANALAAEVVKLGVVSGKPNPASVIQPAIPPVDPSSPHILVNTVIGVVLGLFLGSGLAVLLSSLRNRSRSETQST
jgi:polysaccharide biosynthesis transport protein